MAKSKYKPEYCELIIEHMKDGSSLLSFCNRVGVSRSTVFEWEKLHQDFSNAKKEAQDRSEGWWEDLGRKHAKDNIAAWIFMMKARFGWRDKDANTINVNAQMPDQKVTEEEMTKILAKAMQMKEDEEKKRKAKLRAA